MAGAFSRHLIDSFLTSQQYTRGPFGQPLASSSTLPLSKSGAILFAPSMHGAMPSQSFSSEPSFMDLSEESAKRIASLQARLDKKLGPEYISQRPGPGGGPKLTYAEGWKIINLANEIFGFNGWSSNVVNLTTDFIDCQEETKRYSVGVTAVVRITLRDGVYHEDVGYGLLENSKSKGAALDKCKKEAVTDAVKRALRNFGNVLGNCLYDKSYTQEVVKIKVPPPKFNKDDLHRRPEFDQVKPNVSSYSAGPSTSAYSRPNPSTSTSASAVKQEFTSVLSSPAFSKPATNQRNAHISTSLHQHNVPGTSATVQTPSMKGKEPIRAGEMGLNTPVTPGNISGANRPVHQHNNNIKQNQVSGPPQQQPQQTDRWVSFAPVAAPATAAPAPAPETRPSTPDANPANDIPTLDDEDSFLMNSEDEAFFAGVNLGEQGLGGPIDFDEGTGGISADGSIGGDAEGRKDDPTPQKMQPQQVSLQQQFRPATPQPQQSRPPQVPQRPHTTRPDVKQQDSARPAPTTPTSSGGAPGARTPMPSGGFHFPPGMNPQNMRSGPPGPPARQQNGANDGGIGLKRTAAQMQGQGVVRRPAQGMGLAPHSNGGGWSAQQGQGAKREPLGTIALGDGGDIKRHKR